MPHIEDTGEVNWLVRDATRLEVAVPVIAHSVTLLCASRDHDQHWARAIGQSDVDEVFAADRDETALFHAAHVCAAFNAINRLVEGLGIEADENDGRDGSQSTT